MKCSGEMGCGSVPFFRGVSSILQSVKTPLQLIGIFAAFQGVVEYRLDEAEAMPRVGGRHLPPVNLVTVAGDIVGHHVADGLGFDDAAELIQNSFALRCHAGDSGGFLLR